MRVLEAPTYEAFSSDEVLVFLAGGITGCHDWQDQVIEELSKKKHTEKLVILNPRRKNFPISDPNAAREQIAWEFRMLEACDIFSIYFVNSESDQPICMYELGRNICRMEEKHYKGEDILNKIVTVEKGYKRAQDVDIQLGLTGASIEKNMDGNVESHAFEIYTCYRYWAAKKQPGGIKFNPEVIIDYGNND